MAKQSYIEQMISIYGDNWITGVNPEGIQKMAKRVFKEMIKGQIDYEKHGQYFLDPKFLDNLIIAASNELEINNLLMNALSYYRDGLSSNPDMKAIAYLAANGPIINSELLHLQALGYIYSTILDRLNWVKVEQNIGYFSDVSGLLFSVKNHLQ